MKAIITVLLLSLSTSALTAESQWEKPENLPKGQGNPDLESNYFGRDLGHTSMTNHYMINVLVGSLTGSIFGMGAGLAAVDTSGNTDSVVDSGLPFVAVGFLVGAGLAIYATIDEISANQQFTTGKHMWQAGWYGAILGGLTGTMIGLIPYSSSKNDADILRFTGLGVLAGVPISLILWAVFDDDPLQSGWVPDVQYVASENESQINLLVKSRF